MTRFILALLMSKGKGMLYLKSTLKYYLPNYFLPNIHYSIVFLVIIT